LVEFELASSTTELETLTQLRVLLIEDSLVIRQNLTEFLQELAPIRVVHSVEDEASAIEWLRDESNQCDLAIVDIFLRRGTGLQVLEFASSLNRQLCLVVLSNSATADMRRKCMQLGAHAVFDKSTEIEELLSYCARLATGETGPGRLEP
jgi:DNA-binding NarL/FixJ family response regulator